MANSLPDISLTGNSPPLSRHFTPTLFLFVVRFARVRIGDSSRNRFASTAYFACGEGRGGTSGGGNRGEHRVETFVGESSGHLEEGGGSAYPSLGQQSSEKKISEKDET